MTPHPRAAAALVFARAPVLGAVKTRLAAAVGPARALAVYDRLARDVVRALTPAPRTWDVVVLGTPDDACDAIGRWLPEADAVWPQGGGDLGARLTSAVARAFDLGYRRVCLLGTDCPAVDAERVRSLFAALDTHDAVLGPAEDGGYWALGLARPLPLFDGVAWSTDRVAAQTRDRLRACGATWAEADTARDLDTADDLAGWIARGWVAP